jgi:uncharacterized RDD family membrane protein YckC
MQTEKYRTGLKRLWAAIVDSIIFMPLLLVDKWLFTSGKNNSLLTSWIIFTTFLPIVYSIFLHYKYGQTIGKWVAGIKVLDATETKNISIKQSIARDSVYLIVQLIALSYFLVQSFTQNNNEIFITDFNDFSSTPLLVWTLLELITMLTNSKRRAVHDFLAKSVVVRAPMLAQACNQ